MFKNLWVSALLVVTLVSAVTGALLSLPSDQEEVNRIIAEDKAVEARGNEGVCELARRDFDINRVEREINYGGARIDRVSEEQFIEIRLKVAKKYAHEIIVKDTSCYSTTGHPNFAQLEETREAMGYIGLTLDSIGATPAQFRASVARSLSGSKVLDFGKGGCLVSGTLTAMYTQCKETINILKDWGIDPKEVSSELAAANSK